jgi:carboxymethylenebutenolidase
VALAGEVLHPELLRSEQVSFESDGARIDAYLARPAEDVPAPGVVVIHEIFGPVEHIRDVARRFAGAGYNALAPNLYSRQGAPDPTDFDACRARAVALPDEQAVRDLANAAAYLRDLDGATGKVGVIGFCSGGRHTLLAACASDAFDAAVDCWGGMITRATPDDETTAARPRKPIDLVADLSCPLYAVFGRSDQNPSPEVARELEQQLAGVSQPSTVEIFENAGHAFFADYRPSYVEAAAFDLWSKVLAFFERHLRN